MNERNLLLVDDEINILSSIRRALRKENINITCANSANEAREALLDKEYGVIISDQRMPDTTGTEFLSQVKMSHPSSVRIILSGYSDLTAVLEAINKGAIYKFITKPWEDEHLKELVSEAFTQYELKMENKRLNRKLMEANNKLNDINKNLEQIVDQKTRELQLNIKALEISHEIVEHMPVAVIGIDNENNIVLANKKAHQTFAEGDTYLLGRKANRALPENMHTIPRLLESRKLIEARYSLKNKYGRIYASGLNNTAGTSGYVIVFMEHSRWKKS